jgi:hypothetical protein
MSGSSVTCKGCDSRSATVPEAQRETADACLILGWCVESDKVKRPCLVAHQACAPPKEEADLRAASGAGQA